MFHLNAVHYALKAGNASSWFGGMFNRPGADSPTPSHGAWHGLVALLVQLSGLSIAAAGVLSSAFAAFPYLLLNYGTVHPNALSYAILPMGLALVLTLLDQARAPVVPRAVAGLLLVLYLPAQALSQPNGVFSIAFLLSPLLLVLALSWVRAGLGSSRATRWGRAGLVLVSLGGAVGVLAASETVRGLFSWAHPKSMPFGEALWRAATHFPLPAGTPALVLSVLALGGLYQMARDDRRGWMIVSQLRPGLLSS